VSTIELPKGWKRVKFGDVVRKVSDRVDPENAGIERYVAGEHMDTDDLRIRRWGEVGDGYLGPAFHMRFQPGQVLYGSRRTYLRKVALADFEGICANTTFVVESSFTDLLPELLPLVMTTEAFHEHSIKQSKGSVNPYINFSDLTWFEFALPPVDEQQRAIGLLSASDHTIAGYSSLKAAIELLRQSTLSQSIWDDSAKDWRVPLISVAELLVEPPRNGVSPPSAADGTGSRTVSISAVQDGKFLAKPEFLKWCTPRGDASGFVVSRGDAFAVRGNGSRSLVGRLGLCSDEPSVEVLYPDLLIRLRFDSRIIDPELATEIWNLPRVHEALLGRAKSSNGIYKVNGKDISGHRLPVPRPGVQAELLHQLKQLEHVAKAVDKSLATAVQLRRSLLSTLLEATSHVQ
jgi:type I restriction enzyme, S subunit